MFLFAYLKTPLTMNIHSENNPKPDTDSFTKQDKKTGKSCSVALFFFFSTLSDSVLETKF